MEAALQPHDCEHYTNTALSLLNDFSEIIDSDKCKQNQAVKKSLRDIFLKLHGLVNEQAGVIKTLQAAQHKQNLMIPSFANIVSEQSRQDIKFRLSPRTEKHEIMLKPKDKKTSSTDIKTLLRDKIDPSTLKVGIISTRQTRSGGLTVQVDTETSKQILVQAIDDCCDLKDKISAEEIKKLLPRQKVEDVPKDMTDDELIEVMYHRNDEIQSHYKDIQNFKENCVVKYRHAKKNKESDSVVIEVSPGLRKILLGKGYVNLQWTRSSVSDYIHVTKCFQCCGFHHLSRHCKDTQRCGRCAGPHKLADCHEDKVNSRCINCTKHNDKTRKKVYDTNHESVDPECPSYLWAKNQFISRIRFE